jgi:hypothetical protein
VAIRRRKRRPKYGEPDYAQLVTRIPPFWPGTTVRLADGSIRQVTALTGALTDPTKHVVWYVHFGAGRSVPVDDIIGVDYGKAEDR